jgi:hypothetical protein
MKIPTVYNPFKLRDFAVEVQQGGMARALFSKRKAIVLALWRTHHYALTIPVG